MGTLFGLTQDINILILVHIKLSEWVSLFGP